MDLAERIGAPIVGLLDSGGARIQEGVAALAGYGEIFRRNVRLSGRVPQISVVLGPCAGGAVYSPAITDFIILSRPDALMFVTGPKVVKQVLFEDVDAPPSAARTCTPRRAAWRTSSSPTRPPPSRAPAPLLAFLRAPARRTGAARARARRSDEIVTAQLPPRLRRAARHRQARPIRGSVIEIQPDYAKNVVVALARIEGRAVGIVANQPKERAGVLDIDASRKAARFVRTMSAFGIPIVTLVDVPGFMPGSRQEHGGVIVHGAKLLYAYCEARVPRITVVMRKAFGGAYIVMSSKHVGADVNLAWPGAQISVMGAEGAVEILHGKDLKTAADPKARFDELCGRYREEYMSVRVAAERGWIDEVIEPCDTRHKIAHYLGVLESASDTRGAHGNIPL